VIRLGNVQAVSWVLHRGQAQDRETPEPQQRGGAEGRPAAWRGVCCLGGAYVVGKGCEDICWECTFRYLSEPLLCLQTIPCSRLAAAVVPT
jgi:hypothetical protein